MCDSGNPVDILIKIEALSFFVAESVCAHDDGIEDKAAWGLGIIMMDIGSAAKFAKELITNQDEMQKLQA